MTQWLPFAIGYVAMIDSGETDWKVITIASDDPLLSGSETSFFQIFQVVS